MKRVANNGHIYGKIPEELVRFFKSDGGRSLIIKGKAGAGKTTLGLQIVEEFDKEQESYYLSTRVGDEALYSQFSWLAKKKGVRHKKRIITSVERGELNKLEGYIEAGGEGESYEIEDGKLIMNIGAILPELETVYSAVEDNLPEKTVVIIDSIDALSEIYGIEREVLVKTLQKDLVEGTGANLVLILESDKDASLDYFCDGVIHLNYRMADGRIVRMMNLLKLRGVPIQNPTYLFTLKDGRVTILPKFIDIMNKGWMRRPKSKPTRDLSAGLASSGIKDFDDIFGGFSAGSVNVIEYADNVPTDYIDAIEREIITNFVEQGRGVIWITHPRARIGDPVSFLPYGVARNGNKIKNLKVFDVSEKMTSNLAIGLSGVNLITDLNIDGMKRESEMKHPYIYVVDTINLPLLYGDDVANQLIRLFGIIRMDGDIILCTAPEGHKLTKDIASMVATRIKIEGLNGTPVIYGIKPYTGYYGYILDEKTGPKFIPLI
ncbi:MAG: hypothetical protein DRN20_02350 [Thermoplasmata archaeon]|nr:MAG: hypothetical protein DRN20_02350 [Thermoplasmata archaeon]